MNQTDEIKNKVDIVGLISSYLTLKKAGRNYRACCPFHKEKTPSFMVSPEKQIWYCFGCNQGGDIFSFVEKIEGVDFVSSLNMLAEKAGIILDKKNYAQKGEKDKYFEILETANRFYTYLLNEHPVGREAKKYLLEKRGLMQATIESFSIGFAPEGSALLKGFLNKKGFSDPDLIKVGVIAQDQRGRTVDKFRNRIVFPIYSVNSKVLGFGGRIFKENKNPNFTPPKYLNSPQSDVYDKSSVLYGLDKSKEAIREKDLAIIVEGYLDVISSHQSGVKNVVASSGTALTEKQVEILSRYTQNIAFAFDADEAGQMATKRAMELTRFSDINIMAILIKGAKDPDELIQKSPDDWRMSCETPIPILEFIYLNLLTKFNDGKTSEDKKSISKEFIPLIAALGNEIEKGHWARKVSFDLNIEEKYITSAISKIKLGNAPLKEPSAKEEIRLKISKSTLLIFGIIIYPEKMEYVLENIKEEEIVEENALIVYKIVKDWYINKKEGEVIDFDYIKKKIPEDKQSNFDLLLFLTTSFFEELDADDGRHDIDYLLSVVKKELKDMRKKQIEQELSLLNKDKDRDKITKLLKELQSLV